MSGYPTLPLKTAISGVKSRRKDNAKNTLCIDNFLRFRMQSEPKSRLRNQSGKQLKLQVDITDTRRKCVKPNQQLFPEK